MDSQFFTIDELKTLGEEILSLYETCPNCKCDKITISQENHFYTMFNETIFVKLPVLKCEECDCFFMDCACKYILFGELLEKLQEMQAKCAHFIHHYLSYKGTPKESPDLYLRD